jgi:hypothetical protein
MKKLSLLFGLLASLALIFAIAPFISTEKKVEERQIIPPMIEPTKPKDVSPPLSINKGEKLYNDNTPLPAGILAMRERLLRAAETGNITRLKIAFETNEVMPAFSTGPDRDPVPYWKKRSGDGEGREVLGALANILSLPAGRINIGKPTEMVVYPYLATIPLQSLTSEQKVDLYRLLPADEAKAMVQFGSYIYWRVGIGKDGTLHYFRDGK